MPAQQLHLFAAPRPLEERVGKAFFAAVPRCPGVYIMTGIGDRVLYIGQSSNLRARLASYKNARLDRAPRKVVRLVHQVDKIVWERCDSPRAAQLRESELLLLHRPRFNRMGTFPRTEWLLEFRADASGLELNRRKASEVKGSWLSRTDGPADPLSADCENIYGPFIHGMALHSALARSLWVICGGVALVAAFPAGLMNWRVPPMQRIQYHESTSAGDRRSVTTQLQQLLLGENTDFLARLRTLASTLEAHGLQEVVLADLELLQKVCANSEKESASAGFR